MRIVITQAPSERTDHALAAESGVQHAGMTQRLLQKLLLAAEAPCRIERTRVFRDHHRRMSGRDCLRIIYKAGCKTVLFVVVVGVYILDGLTAFECPHAVKRA